MLAGYSRAGGTTSVLNVPSVVSGIYPLFTCPTGTGGYVYNEMCCMHMSEKDLLSLVDYRKKTGESPSDGTGVETNSFVAFTSQAPYMYLDHSQIVNYRHTNYSENRSVSFNPSLS